MAIKYSIEKHAVCYPSKMLATKGGKHIYNIQLTADTDNGAIVGKGDFVELDVYKEAAAGAATFTILEQANNGNWYVEVVDPQDALLVYQVPMIAEEYNREFKDLANFYNEKDDVVRCYEMAKGDVFEISEAGFDGTPAAGESCTATSKALKVATAG